ncbi:C-X-C motif chemokine 11-6-like [Carassius gibelio]|uniref:C-X-C motif chemokine 11-6-like n=1 Tax=Carassius gibelio TaxID=101364 RepID=UPI0022775D1F|nr:C-X-C motif chemokine 11-6-like [Carassius gibelio]
MKTTAVFVFLSCLLPMEVQGHKFPKVRCICADKGVNGVNGRQEIIVNLKSTERKCLNPESKFTQNLIKRVLEKMARQ